VANRLINRVISLHNHIIGLILAIPDAMGPSLTVMESTEHVASGMVGAALDMVGAAVIGHE